MMECPQCRSENNIVVKTEKMGESTRRIRRCQESRCLHAFYTWEETEENNSKGSEIEQEVSDPETSETSTSDPTTSQDSTESKEEDKTDDQKPGETEKKEAFLKGASKRKKGKTRDEKTP